ncbi:MAG TPA: acyl-CoA thioesterase domain-containing protein [Acidimicrobiia bacterium]|nr:acyl-CoA thioesterase domain-containing protein [Acidimicrobiia bacterium]
MTDAFAHPTPAEASPRDVDHLVALLELEEIDRDLYRATNPADSQRFRLFGGQVAAQAVRAANLTAPEGRMLHSLHGYFLRPGSPDRPTILHVDRDRDGRSFSARHVVARQNGDAIFSMLASFHVDESGDDLQVPALPDVPLPEDLSEGEFFGFGPMFDLRTVPAPNQSDGNRRLNRYWARTRAPLPDDALVHQCVLTFLSDVGTGFYELPTRDTPMGGPSLDHAVWFHDPDVRLDDWVLFDLAAVRLARGRGYYTGSVYDSSGTLVASIAQEHLWRELRLPPGMEFPGMKPPEPPEQPTA